MNSSIEGLAKNLKEFPTLTKFFGRDKAKDLKRKGVFPYEWFDDISKLNQTEFPEYECFRSTLRGLEEKKYFDTNGNEQTTLVGVNVEKKDYDYGVEIYNKYCTSFKDFHNLYIQVDIILLCDIFEEFSDMCFRHFELYPQNYYTAPGYAWDALLLFSGAKLEPLVDEDMYIFDKIYFR